jgi:hypothetical protein
MTSASQRGLRGAVGAFELFPQSQHGWLANKLKSAKQMLAEVQSVVYFTPVTDRA